MCSFNQIEDWFPEGMEQWGNSSTKSNPTVSNDNNQSEYQVDIEIEYQKWLQTPRKERKQHIYYEMKEIQDGLRTL